MFICHLKVKEDTTLDSKMSFVNETPEERKIFVLWMANASLSTMSKLYYEIEDEMKDNIFPLHENLTQEDTLEESELVELAKFEEEKEIFWRNLRNLEADLNSLSNSLHKLADVVTPNHNISF